VQHVGGEITKEFAIGDFEISPPHLFLYLFLFKRKTKVETKKRTLPGLNTGESKLYSMKAFFLELIFIFLFLLLFYCYFYMANWT